MAVAAARGSGGGVMTGDAKTTQAAPGEIYWPAHIAAFGDQAEFLAGYEDLGPEFRAAVDAGADAVADAVRERLESAMGALIGNWREQLRDVELAPFADYREVRTEQRVRAETLRTLIRQAEEAVNAALKGGMS